MLGGSYYPYLLNCCENKEVKGSLTIGENYYIYA